MFKIRSILYFKVLKTSPISKISNYGFVPKTRRNQTIKETKRQGEEYDSIIR